MARDKRVSLEQRCRLAFLAGIHDHELRSGLPLTNEQLRRALRRYHDLATGCQKRPNP